MKQHQPVNLDFACPFCGLSTTIIADGEVPAIMHKMPACDGFLSLDALEFVAAVRREHVGPMPWDREHES